MASRVRVAASACLVASGLFISGAGGAIAFADPGHGYGNARTTPQGDGSIGDVIRQRVGPRTARQRSEGRRNRAGQRPRTPCGGNRPRPGDKPARRRDSRSRGEAGRLRPRDPPDKSPQREHQVTIPTTTTPPNHRVDQPPTAVRAAAEVAAAAAGSNSLPRFKPPSVPDMQLPGELQPTEPGVPGGPGVLDAGAGCGRGTRRRRGTHHVAGDRRATAGPLGPLGAPEASDRRGHRPDRRQAPHAASLPSRRQAASRRPRMRAAMPVVPASSYRIGYTEYLRTAGLPQVAALAVPGLAGILLLTGAGGLVGYRQAKAGHAVRRRYGAVHEVDTNCPPERGWAAHSGLVERGSVCLPVVA